MSSFGQIENNSKVGFFPFFGTLGDTLPLIQIAKKWKQIGGTAIFFSHGGKYEKLVKENGLKIVKVEPYYSNLTDIKVKKMFYGKKNFTKPIEGQIKAYKETGVEMIVTCFHLRSKISARAMGIPLVSIVSGTMLPEYYRSGFATYPEDFKFYILKLIPKSVMNRIINWYMPRSKKYIRQFNKVAKKYNIKKFQNYIDLILGDYTLLCDDINFLGLKPTDRFPIKNYLGPILSESLFRESIEQLDPKIKQHLKRDGYHILLSMGSSGDKKLFLKILKSLNNTKYNVICINANILDESEIPDLADNILFLQYASSIKSINEVVDLAIIHGGRGTVYTAAYSGKPVIGIPMQLEQQFNLDCLIRHGCGLRISKKPFNKIIFLSSIRKILNDYDNYLDNAQKLSKKLPKPNGEKKAIERIIEILKQT